MSSATAQPPLFVRLRTATKEAHQELEDRLDPLHRFRERATYVAYLARIHPLYRGLEEELSRFDWAALGLDFNARRKTALIESDLAALGSAPEADFPALPVFASRPEAIGALYVMEGATLGGQMISRHLPAMGIDPAGGGAFFNGYGERTGAMWKDFQQAAARGAASEPEIAAAVHGAQALFALFTRRLTEPAVVR